MIKERVEYRLKANNIFSFWFVFSFILNGYATGIPGVSLGSAVLVILFIITVFQSVRKGILSIERPIISFALIITLTSLFGTMIFNIVCPELIVSSSKIVLGTAKFWIWVFMSAFVAVKKYDNESFTKWMVFFATVMTIYLIFQCIFYYGPHIYLPNIFRFGPLRPYAEGYANYDKLGNAGLLRPAGLLSESSYYGNFVLCTTVLYLEKNIKQMSKKKILYVVFLCMGIILSGSTSAIIFQGIVLILYLRKAKSSLKVQMLIIIPIVAILICVLWVNFFNESFIGHTLEYAFNKFGYLDKSTRFGKSYNYLHLLPKNLFFLGTGIGSDQPLISMITRETSVYLNSITSLIIQTGIIGCVLFLFLMLFYIKEAFRFRNTLVFSLIATYFVKGFASGIFFSTYGILFMFIIVGQLRSQKSFRTVE